MSQSELFNDIERRAHFTDGNRITLTRTWNKSMPIALVIGCNPSTANGLDDDPTTRWWNKWFRQAGFGGYIAMNLYPFCTSNPLECRQIADWEDAEDWAARDAMQANMLQVVAIAKQVDEVYVCWGAIAWDQDWIDLFVEEIQGNEEPWPDLLCWGATMNGAPKHPLARGKHRIDPNQQPIVWKEAN